MKVLLAISVACVSACSWFGGRRPAPPEPTELIVTGAPVGSTLFVDGAQIGEPQALAPGPQLLHVTPGAHTVEIRLGEPVVYREQTDVAPGHQQIVTVLSGAAR